MTSISIRAATQTREPEGMSPDTKSSDPTHLKFASLSLEFAASFNQQQDWLRPGLPEYAGREEGA
jgi:hypothetical protein